MQNYLQKNIKQVNPKQYSFMKNKEYYFKVKTGYKQNEFVIVSSGIDLEKVMYAFIQGDVVANVKGMSIRGRHIISIEPDFHSYTKWFRSYEPKSGEDFKQIERDMPNEIEDVMQLYQTRVMELANNDQGALIGRTPMFVESDCGILRLSESSQ
jgi:hypothetical protein